MFFNYFKFSSPSGKRILLYLMWIALYSVGDGKQSNVVKRVSEKTHFSIIHPGPGRKRFQNLHHGQTYRSFESYA